MHLESDPRALRCCFRRLVSGGDAFFFNNTWRRRDAVLLNLWNNIEQVEQENGSRGGRNDHHQFAGHTVRSRIEDRRQRPKWVGNMSRIIRAAGNVVGIEHFRNTQPASTKSAFTRTAAARLI